MKLTGKLVGAAIAATVAVAAPVAANATTVITTTTVKPGAHTTTFARNFTYKAAFSGRLAVYVSSIQSGPFSNVDFSNATLTGKKGKLTLLPVTNLVTLKAGVSELRELLYVPATAGETFTLATYLTSEKLSSYKIQWVLGVPEPATWALMILGFGMVGYSMRRRVAKTGNLVAA